MPPVGAGVGIANRPGDGGMGGRHGGGGPWSGGTHTFPSGNFRYGIGPYYRYPYPYTTVTTVRSTPMFGLQGKGLIVGLLLGFFALPFLINAVRR